MRVRPVLNSCVIPFLFAICLEPMSSLRLRRVFIFHSQCARSLIKKSKQHLVEWSKMSFYRPLFALLAVFFAASCTYNVQDDSPVHRKFSWFSYINGDDIRKVCADLGADRYRFVYNAHYQAQTRSYDVSFTSKKIVMQVSGPSDFSKWTSADLLSPWKGAHEELQVADKELKHLKSALKASAALQPNQGSLRLYSDKFYWTVAACVEGEFYFTGYLHGTERWKQIQFADVLFSLDVTGVEVRKPGGMTPQDLWGKDNIPGPFLIEVRGNGLVGYAGS